MSACDVNISTDFPITEQNVLENVADGVERLLNNAVDRAQDQIRELRELIEFIYNLPYRRVDPLHWDLSTPGDILWNELFRLLRGHLAELEAQLLQVEQDIAEARETVGPVLQNVGNPQKLADIARLLEEGVASQSSALEDEIQLIKLAVDNEWDGEAAERYTERAQLQGSEGLAKLAARAEALARVLREHSEAELGFWEDAASYLIDVIMFIVGIVIAAAGIIVGIVGLVAAVLSGGPGIVISLIGLVIAVVGAYITLASGFKALVSIVLMINSANQALEARVAAIEADTLPIGTKWPVLAQ